MNRRSISAQGAAARDKRRTHCAMAKPSTLHARVNTQLCCQPPTWVAHHATSGGPMSCPADESYCIQPTVVDTRSGLGARCTAEANKAPGTSPPSAENTNTPANRQGNGTPSINAKQPPKAMAP